MLKKTPKRWITALVAQSAQHSLSLPWHRAAKHARRAAALAATRDMELA